MYSPIKITIIVDL